MKVRIVYRSAITGKFVSREYAEKHPDTTIAQKVRVRRPPARSVEERQPVPGVYRLDQGAER